MSAFTDLFNGVTGDTSLPVADTDGFTDSTSFIGGIKVDLVEEASSSKKWELARHVIDRRSDIADHRLKIPENMVLKILVTDDEAVPIDASANTGDVATRRTYKDKIDELDEFVEIDQIVEVVMPWKVYPEMMVTSLDPLPSKSVENGMEFNITLSAVKLSGVQISNVDPSMVPQKRKQKVDPPATQQEDEDSRKGEGNLDTGTKAPEEPPASWLKQIGNAVGF